MKRFTLLVGMLALYAFCSVSYATPPLDQDDDMWRVYMSPPRNQLTDGFSGFACETYALVGCLEGIYNGLARTDSTTKVRLLLNQTHHEPPFSPDPNFTAYPNYPGVAFNYNGTVSVSRTDLKAWLGHTPVCVKIRDFPSIFEEGESWTLEDDPITWNGIAPDSHHWVVCVGWKVKNNKDVYIFFNQMGEDWGDSGFFEMYEDNMNTWYMDGLFPLIYKDPDGINRNNHSLDETQIEFGYVPHIYPAFFPNSSFIGTKEISGTSYIVGDLKISSGEALKFGNNSVVKFDTTERISNEGGYSGKTEIIVNGGSLEAGNNVVFQSIAQSPSQADWGQIKATNNGYLTIRDNVTIRDATIGLNIESGGNFIDFPAWDGSTAKKCTISNCLDWGMLISSNASDIQNIEFSGNGTTDYHGSLCVMGGSSGPTINHVTITDNTVYGAYVTNYSNMTLQNSILNSSIQRHMVFLYSPSTSLSLNGSHNNFLYTGNGDYHAIWNPSGVSLNVNNNYWNGVTNANLLFENPADIIWTDTYYNSTAGAYKLAAPDPFLEAEQMEKDGALIAARDMYRRILTENTNPHDKSRAMKSLIRDYEIDPGIHDYIECDRIIDGQMSSSDGWYKALLDYLKCDLAVKAARKAFEKSTLPQKERETQYLDDIDEAVRRFVSKSEEYTGDPMQVEMLSRAAVLCGDYLGDRIGAKQYADRASAINPGQPIILVAYQAAGIEYDPWKYTDIYFGKEIDNQPFEKQSTGKPVVSVTPNPFNPSTSIAFSLNAPSRVKIAVYSINGQKVADLTNKTMSAGRHSVVFDGTKHASGVYFYRFESDAGIRTGKMLLVK